MTSNGNSVNTTRAIIKCVNFAADKHRQQRRKDHEKTPYINHPIGVAFILTEEAGIFDVATIQAALLHDTVEDTNTTFEEIEEHFGKEVCDIVKEVTDDKTLPSADRKRLQIEHAPKASYKAKLVKLADKLNNLRDLSESTPVGWSEARVDRYFVWARNVISGLRGTNENMENALRKVYDAKGLAFDAQ